MRTISLFTHISLLCWGSFWILNRSDCYELYIKTVKLTLIVVFLHEEKQLIASFESLVSALIHSKRPKATFCGFLVSWGQTNKLCEEFSNTVGSESALYFNSDFPQTEVRNVWRLVWHGFALLSSEVLWTLTDAVCWLFASLRSVGWSV